LDPEYVDLVALVPDRIDYERHKAAFFDCTVALMRARKGED
jgi:hypothetical protein